MDYNIEEIIQSIRTARKDKRLSQRALSKRAGIPQSHISNIENGSVDIKLSTLIELARALDLEVTLVPRKSLPAVQSITRSVQAESSNTEMSRAARNELTRIRKTLKVIQASSDTVHDIQKIQQAARELSNLYKIPSEFTKQLHSITETLRAFQGGVTAAKEIQKAAKSMQGMRNQIVHGIPKLSTSPKPAYSLEEEDENG